jgi:hypothetical protein
MISCNGAGRAARAGIELFRLFPSQRRRNAYMPRTFDP